MTLRGIAGSWLLIGDGETAPIEGGALLLDAAERVVAVGAGDALRTHYADARWEQHAAVLTPGLVNAHTHLELSALRGKAPGGRGFVPWLEGMLEARDTLGATSDLESIDAGVGELLKTGTVAVGEVSNTLAPLESLSQAPIAARIFHEIYGMGKGGEQRLREAEQTWARRGDGLAENLSYTLAPHTLYTLDPQLVRELLARARRDSALTSLHLAEHPAERRFLQDGGGPFGRFVQSKGADTTGFSPPATDPVHYAEQLGALAKDVLCVHLADARRDELERVARAGAPVVLCPRSNLHISLKLPPLLEMLEAGLRPALGTDSLASCPSLDVLEEARALSERFPTVPARTLLAMLTGWGAAALGLQDRLGTLSAGRAPGVLAFEHAPGAVPKDPEAFVISRAPAARQVLSRPRHVL
ncbi:MAG: amidohydrolase family protein [Myxococcales bacterium]|nr:amidohydrolase family protein [Myxococcales bacterium]